MDDKEIRDIVFNKLNKILGDDINNLEKCYDLQEELLKSKEKLEQSVCNNKILYVL